MSEFNRMRLRPLAPLLLALTTAASFAAHAAEPPLAHKAEYELKLETSRGSDINGAQGRMEYELTDACDGWATRQRLAIQLNTRDGQQVDMVSDYTTWESKDGLSMRFRMRQTTDDALTDQAEGSATLDAPGAAGAIRYTVPEEKEVAMPAGTVFPMQHTETIIGAAEAGKKFIGLPIFDGTGDRGAQDSSAVIIDWQKGGPAPYPVLENMGNGRVRIAFFDRSKPQGTSNKPLGSPDYEVGMRYWANGVADDLHMDFGDFVMAGRLKALTPIAPHC